MAALAEQVSFARCDSRATLSDQVVDVFRRSDPWGKGTITRSQVRQVLRALGGGDWADGDVDLLLKGLGAVSGDGDVPCEQLVRWILDAPNAPVANDEVCQAAFEGRLSVLKELQSSLGSDAIRGCAGFIEQSGLLAGMWTMIPNTFQLKAVKDDPEMLPATALQWAAFGGRAEVVSFLIGDCGVARDDEGGFGWAPSAIAGSHRLRLGGECVVDDGEVQSLLEDGEEPLPAGLLDFKATLRGGPGLMSPQGQEPGSRPAEDAS